MGNKPMDGVVEHIGDGSFLENVPAELIKEYLAEATHNNWDGWEEYELVHIRQLMADMYLYFNSVGLYRRVKE